MLFNSPLKLFWFWMFFPDFSGNVEELMDKKTKVIFKTYAIIR